MRLASLFCATVLLAGICVAQSTNFPAGPQYLITSDSPYFLHSIATPSLSLQAPLPEFQPLPQIGPAVESEPIAANAGGPQEPNLFPIYYGSHEATVIEISSAEPPRELPASILDNGVTGVTDVQSLRERGYGVSIGDTASFWKARKPHAPRVYTNADIQRLHQS